VTIAGWGVLGSALLTLVASFFPFWSVTGTGIFLSASTTASGWYQWWWIPIVLAVAVGVVYALELFGIVETTQVKPEWLAYGAAASFVLMLIVMIQAFLYTGPGGVFADFPHGHGFGVFFAVVTTAALTYFTPLAAQSSGANLPFKVPGPA